MRTPELAHRWFAGRTAAQLVAAAALLIALAGNWNPASAQQPQPQQQEPVTIENATLETVDQLAEHPLKPSLKLALRAEQTLLKVKDYSAVFIKRELFDGEVSEH